MDKYEIAEKLHKEVEDVANYNYRFWHESTERCKEIYESYCRSKEPDLDREVIAVLELNWVDIELQIEKINNEVELTLFTCSMNENREWCSDDYIDGSGKDIIAGFNSWEEIEEYLLVELKFYCINKGFDYTSDVRKLTVPKKF